MRKTTFSEIITRTLSDEHTVYEAALSTRELSVREMRYGPRRIRHRFPIKGGVTARALLVDNLSQNNALLARLKQKTVI